MSLINQMLRDLEQRKPNKLDASQPLSIQLPQPRKTGTNTKFLWIALVALAAVFFAYQAIKQPSTLIIAKSPEVPVKHQPDNIELTKPDDDIQISPAPTEDRTNSDAELVPVQQPTGLAEIIQASTTTDNMQTSDAVETAQALTAIAVNKPAKPAKDSVFDNKTQKLKRQTPLTIKSPESNTQALYRQAQNSTSLLMRKEILKDLLAINPQDLSARNLLLQTLLKSNSSAELDIFLQESLQLFPNHLAFITTQAHSQIQRKQIAAAIATLERVDSSQINEPTYLSLLAAAFQQLQQYQKAAAIYQKLTQIQPDKAEHWLGLGICAENLHHNQTAIMSYRQALNINTLNSQVVDYIKQRLTSLN
jgi:MSHA biogenesis protein MshN